MSPGKSYLVGERGPEMFVPNQNGVIVPRIPAAAARGSSGPVNVTFAPVINGSNMKPEDVATQLRQFTRLELPGLVRKATSDQ